MTQKNANSILCEKCDFKCSKKSNYEKHLATRKHQSNYNCLQPAQEIVPKKYQCICGKEYNHRQGLYVHKKKCEGPLNDNNDVGLLEVSHLTNLVIELINNNKELQKQNQEFQKEMLVFQKQMVDVCKNTNTTNM